MDRIQHISVLAFCSSRFQIMLFSLAHNLTTHKRALSSHHQHHHHYYTSQTNFHDCIWLFLFLSEFFFHKMKNFNFTLRHNDWCFAQIIPILLLAEWNVYTNLQKCSNKAFHRHVLNWKNHHELLIFVVEFFFEWSKTKYQLLKQIKMQNAIAHIIHKKKTMKDRHIITRTKVTCCYCIQKYDIYFFKTNFISLFFGIVQIYSRKRRRNSKEVKELESIYIDSKYI